MYSRAVKSALTPELERDPPEDPASEIHFAGNVTVQSSFFPAGKAKRSRPVVSRLFYDIALGTIATFGRR